MSRLISALVLCVPLLAIAEPPRVADLAWMTGSWDSSGDVVLEENWGLPRAGTIVSLVRQTAADGTRMVEIVHIEEANGTLELYLQQWDVPFKPRTPAAAKMVMREMTESSITFDAVAEGGLKSLKYSRVHNEPDDPADDEFVIDVVLPNGQDVQIKLTRQER